MIVHAGNYTINAKSHGNINHNGATTTHAICGTYTECTGMLTIQTTHGHVLQCNQRVRCLFQSARGSQQCYNWTIGNCGRQIFQATCVRTKFCGSATERNFNANPGPGRNSIPTINHGQENRGLCKKRGWSKHTHILTTRKRILHSKEKRAKNTCTTHQNCLAQCQPIDATWQRPQHRCTNKCFAPTRSMRNSLR